jgi:hypothetical protein
VDGTGAESRQGADQRHHLRLGRVDGDAELFVVNHFDEEIDVPQAARLAAE